MSTGLKGKWSSKVPIQAPADQGGGRLGTLLGYLGDQVGLFWSQQDASSHSYSLLPPAAALVLDWLSTVGTHRFHDNLSEDQALGLGARGKAFGHLRCQLDLHVPQPMALGS